MVIRHNNGNNNKKWSNSSWQSRRGGAPPSLPARIKCSRGEWKDQAQFSNKNLQEYSRLVEAGIATADNSKILCREHTSNQVTEIQCRTCHQMMAVQHFSKSTRRNKQYICKDCVSYHTAEKELNLPPPNAQLSPDEIAAAQQTYQDIESLEDCGVYVSGSGNRFEDYDEDAEDEGGDAKDESNSNGTWDDSSAGSSFGSESLSDGYSSDGSEGTLRAGLGSHVYSEPREKTPAPQLNAFSVPSRPKTNNSGSWFSSANSNTGSTSYSTSKTTWTTKTTTTVSDSKATTGRKSKWPKPGKKCDMNVPDYVRTRVWTDENVSTPREVDYESDDSL